jgi:hypothetical protein
MIYEKLFVIFVSTLFLHSSLEPFVNTSYYEGLRIGVEKNNSGGYYYVTLNDQQVPFHIYYAVNLYWKKIGIEVDQTILLLDVTGTETTIANWASRFIFTDSVKGDKQYLYFTCDDKNDIKGLTLKDVETSGGARLPIAPNKIPTKETSLFLGIICKIGIL